MSAAPTAPHRPALRYLGGKWRLAPWIISHFPPHRVYVEPFGGAASVLLRKPRAYGEVYNDLDGDVVNLFRVLRDDELSARLIRLVSLTPYAREEFFAAYERTDEPVERARRLCVRSYMGFGSNAANIARNTGFRSNTTRRSTTPVLDWASYPPALAKVAERFQGVQVENRPALDVFRNVDDDETLTYADPTYVHSTRSAKRAHGQLACAYPVEMSDDDHLELIEALRRARGMVVLSGYQSPLYDAALCDWVWTDRKTMADGARPRVERLWLNAKASMRLQQAQEVRA